MAQFSFDVVSDFDHGEMNHVFDQVQRELTNRYDFKGTSVAVEWMDGDKNGLKITGDNDYHIDAVIDMVRKKLGKRGLSQKILDTSKNADTGNLKVTKEVPFKQGLDQEKAKKITKLIKEEQPKVKTQIQSQEVRVMSAKKDELQATMQLLKNTDFDFPLSFTNLR